MIFIHDVAGTAGNDVLSKLYPINLDLEGRRCVVVGGGAVAERKVRSLLQAGGQVTVVAPRLSRGLAELAGAGQLDWYEMGFVRGMLQELSPALVFCASDDTEANELAAEEARAVGALVNAAAEPELTDFTVPASVRRGDFLVTVSTGGASPALSRALRQELEQEFPAAFGDWLKQLHALRHELQGRLPSAGARQEFWRQALSKNVLDLVRDGQLARAEAEIRNAIDNAGAQS